MKSPLFLASLAVVLCACEKTPPPPVEPKAGGSVPGENIDVGEKEQAAALRPVRDLVQDEIRRFQTEVRGAFAAGRFDALEKQAEELRAGKELFSNGSWKIAQFYEGFDVSDHAPFAEWERLDAKHKEWIAAMPESVTARIAYAEFLTHYAWHARGTGYANTVSDEGWRQFGERLHTAGETLRGARQMPVKDPYLWRVALTVALGQGWTPEQYDALMDDAHAAEPAFWDYDVSRAYSLLPRWHGEPGDWEAFAEHTAARPDGPGAEVYARIVASQAGFYENVFRETQASWPKTKQGLDLLREKYPDSLDILSQAAFLATCAQDRTYAKAAFDQLDDRYVRGCWPSRESFVHYRNWARTGQW